MAMKPVYLLGKWIAVNPKTAAAVKAKQELDAANAKANEAAAKLEKLLLSAVVVPEGATFVLSRRFGKLSYNFRLGAPAKDEENSIDV